MKQNYLNQDKIEQIIRIMTTPSSSKQQTRGRPRKNPTQKLPQITRKLFSQHSAVYFSTCLIYTLQLFHDSKHQKHNVYSQGGFTIYEKLNSQYCFESVLQDCRQWKLTNILSNENILNFIKLANGAAPKFVFHQILILFETVLMFLSSQQIQSQDQFDNKLSQLLDILTYPQQQINSQYKYIRFTQPALNELYLERQYSKISFRIGKLWHAFVTIMSYTVFCLYKGVQGSKYYKRFFHDAQPLQGNNIMYGDRLSLLAVVGYNSCGLDWQKFSQRNQEQDKEEIQRQDQNQLQKGDLIKEINISQLKLTPKVRFQPILLSNSSSDGSSPYKKVKRDGRV